jgi:hypothetical protein
MSFHEIPFSSQYTDLGDHEWRARGCGVASLKMVMDFYNASSAPSLDELLKTGREIGAHIEGVGWSHFGLVRLAQRYGLDGFNADWAERSPTPKTAEDAWAILASELEHGPVLASVYNGMDPIRGGGHIVVITGFHNGLVFFNDPEQMVEREGRRILALGVFLLAFKRRYIVIRPATETMLVAETGV